MSVRLATPKDEPAMATICAAAFFEEHLFGHLIHPKRHQYPNDMQIFWHGRIRKFFNEPRDRIIVATLPIDGAEKIVGMATWQRQGSDPGAQQITQQWTDPGPDAFAPLTSTNNRAIDPSKASILEDSYPFFAHHWQGTTNGLPRANNWYLNLCCIDPRFQKRGIGQALVKWGLERARAENVHASVTTSHSNETFYLRCGFDEIVGTCSEGEGNPLRKANVKGGEILWMWANKDRKQQDEVNGLEK